MRALLCVVIVVGLCGTAVADTLVTDDIVTDTTWDLSGSPYIINHDIYVKSLSTLTIDPCVTVKLDSFSKLRTDQNCTIVAVGGDGSEILFTSGADMPAANDWYAIDLANSPASVFTWCVFEYGRYNLYANGGSDIAISSCLSRYSNNAGFMCEDSSPTITACTATENDQGIRISGDAFPVITGCSITDNNTGIYLNGPDANPVIHSCNIVDNSSENMYVRGYTAGLTVVNAESNWWGADSSADIEETIFIQSAAGPYVEIDFDPWLHESLVEESSWAKVKALYR